MTGFAPGAKATRSLTLTAGHVASYVALIIDYNPLHVDEARCYLFRPSTG